MFYRYFEILLFFYGLDYPYRFILVIFCIAFSTTHFDVCIGCKGLKGG
ncbi:hypothetical protein [Helicobacter pylori]|nr:hypothetical protein [Helicobacter pylori]EJB58795.1 hypothetical protein HPHPH30_0283 [Helicobacter pylori Hp H-30]EJB67134.1 hypothetical protein HPHPH44_0278 [Helicobacter pylori Hp H-44]EJC53025.1 hypothetical protein HPHPP26_0286 [Helicobacter pylori Hp P-26]WRA98531.1 hypothetical protein E5L35_00920 [Helicobacter pylori]